MDSLTKKILFDSGLYPGNPLLPPVNNVGMVYLKEPMLKQAEMDLFDARVALRDFEKIPSPSEEDENELKKKLVALERSEIQYFVKRYGAGAANKTRKVMHGWMDDIATMRSYIVEKLREETATLTSLENKYLNDGSTPQDFQDVLEAVLSVHEMKTEMFSSLTGYINNQRLEDLGLKVVRNGNWAGSLQTDFNKLEDIMSKSSDIANFQKEFPILFPIVDGDYIPGMTYDDDM